ncbi:MAG: bile acid:sodium symporter family protein [Panacagrimonas sp.]
MIQLTTVFLPLALAIIMLGLGLSLSMADFRRVLEQPRAVIVALVCQALVMPLVCFFIAGSFGLAPELAVGLMLLAASPGGTVANLYSHVSNGDVALNITLTAVNSLLCLISLPLIVNFSLVHFMGEGRAVPLPLSKVAQVFAVVLIPVATGMVFRHHWPALSARLEKPVKILSFLFLVLMVTLVGIKSQGPLREHGTSVGLAVLSFNLLSLGVGYGVPRLLRLGERQAIAIGMEIGIHNAALAIAIALSPLMLGNATMAIPATVYGVLMLLTAAGFGYRVSRKTPAQLASQAD